ncbi:TOMM precursor leader peptide-binding protein [Psychromicrobium sp. YIM B11713]|uniref:TOMM precursor leader peptide-binding protein n=1 Tax=Psychromicrobium sp. YIM B11713 TaxID=3145233 RepID=UPI00374F0623
MSTTTYLLTEGTQLSDFEDSFVLVCGSSIVRFRENQEFAKLLFGFLRQHRTAEEVALGVPGLKDPEHLLGALTAAGVVRRSSGLLGEIDGLKELAGAPQRLCFDTPESQEAQVRAAAANFPEVIRLSTADARRLSPVILVRSTVPEMIRECRELFDSGTCFVPVVPSDGEKIIIGPAVVPGLTACFECLIARKAALTDWPDEYLRFHSSSSAGEFNPADLALGLNLAVRLALGAFYQQRGELIGACTIFDPASLTTYSSRVWSVPRCPTCSKYGKLSTSYPWLSPIHSAAG